MMILIMLLQIVMILRLTMVMMKKVMSVTKKTEAVTTVIRGKKAGNDINDLGTAAKVISV